MDFEIYKKKVFEVFTQKEFDDLYEGIIYVGDDRFYRWLYASYPEINETNLFSHDLNGYICQWIVTTNKFQEFREWCDTEF